MTGLKALTEKVLRGEQITKEEAMFLYQQPLTQLCESADEIRRHFCSNQFDICTIINGKSGRCSENCKFCAQSAHNHTGAAQYPLLSAEEILAQAKINHEQGVLRYSIVTSGKRLSDEEIEEMCQVVRRIRKEVGISVCVSFGLLNEQQFRKLKEAGVSRSTTIWKPPGEIFQISVPLILLRIRCMQSRPPRQQDFRFAAAESWGLGKQ